MNIVQETSLPYESCTICYKGGYFHLVLTFPWTFLFFFWKMFIALKFVVQIYTWI